MSDYEIERINRTLRELTEEISDLQDDVIILQKENKNLRTELNDEIENSCNMYTALIEGRDIHITTDPGKPIEFKVQPKSDK